MLYIQDAGERLFLLIKILVMALEWELSSGVDNSRTRMRKRLLVRRLLKHFNFYHRPEVSVNPSGTYHFNPGWGVRNH